MVITDFPRRELPFEAQARGFRLLLKRNCSISPRGLLAVFAALAALTLGIAAAFAAMGAWLILPFAGLEALLLAGAFLVNARHAADYERIELQPERLSVEITDAARTSRYELDPRLARVCLESAAGPDARVRLRAAGVELEVGRHLDARARVELAAELDRRLRI